MDPMHTKIPGNPADFATVGDDFSSKKAFEWSPMTLKKSPQYTLIHH